MTLRCVFPFLDYCMLHLQEAIEGMYHVAGFKFHINDIKLVSARFAWYVVVLVLCMIPHILGANVLCNLHHSSSEATSELFYLFLSSVWFYFIVNVELYLFFSFELFTKQTAHHLCSIVCMNRLLIILEVHTQDLVFEELWWSTVKTFLI